jgi:transcriptional regulator with XRE-family HTH domain
VSEATFGKTVRKRRQALKMTLEKFAERAKLSPNYLGTIEAGKRDPSLSTVVGIAKALGTPPAELLGGVNELGPVGTEAGRIIEGLAEEVQESLLSFLRSLARRRR